MTDETFVSKDMADSGDMAIDALFAAVDQEPEELRTRLLAAMAKRDYQVDTNAARTIFYFPTVDKVSYEIPLIRVASMPRAIQ